MPPVDVELVRWPAEADRLTSLRAVAAARLVLVETHADPPTSDDPLEDWIRVPAPDGDVRRRVEGLARRAAATDPDEAVRVRSSAASLDGEVLRTASGWVVLSPIEARLAALLVERAGAVVSRAELVAAAWPDRDVERNLLDVHVARLRRRLGEVGLAVRTVRRRGYLLEPVEGP